MSRFTQTNFKRQVHDDDGDAIGAGEARGGGVEMVAARMEADTMEIMERRSTERYMIVLVVAGRERYGCLSL